MSGSLREDQSARSVRASGPPILGFGVLGLKNEHYLLNLLFGVFGFRV